MDKFRRPGKNDKAFHIRAILLIASLWPQWGKKVRLKFDNCPPPFDFTEAGNISIEEIDKGIKMMKRLSGME